MLTLIGDIGEVNVALTATGTVILAREAILKSPIQSMLRRVALVVGTRVVPGQLLLELNKDLAASALAKLDDEQVRNLNKTAQLGLALARALIDLQVQAPTQALKVAACNRPCATSSTCWRHGRSRAPGHPRAAHHPPGG
jgi:HlyD family secretion protein